MPSAPPMIRSALRKNPGPIVLAKAGTRVVRLLKLVSAFCSMVSGCNKSGPVAQGISSKSGCHQPCRSPISPGSRAQQASILDRSQPAGRKPSIIEPAKVEKRVHRFPGPRNGLEKDLRKRPESEPSVHVDDDLTGERARPTHSVGFEKFLRLGSGGQREGTADQRRLELSLFDPAEHVVGADLLFVRGGVEHGEAQERAIPRVKGPERERRLGGPSGYQHHPAVLAEQGDGLLEVRLAPGLVPDVEAFGGELAKSGGNVVGLVVESQIGAEGLAEFDALGAAGRGGRAPGAP